MEIGASAACFTFLSLSLFIQILCSVVQRQTTVSDVL
jgi:hypothetical protein